MYLTSCEEQHCCAMVGIKPLQKLNFPSIIYILIESIVVCKGPGETLNGKRTDSNQNAVQVSH